MNDYDVCGFCQNPVICQTYVVRDLHVINTPDINCLFEKSVLAEADLRKNPIFKEFYINNEIQYRILNYTGKVIKFTCDGRLVIEKNVFFSPIPKYSVLISYHLNWNPNLICIAHKIFGSTLNYPLPTLYFSNNLNCEWAENKPVTSKKESRLDSKAFTFWQGKDDDNSILSTIPQEIIIIVLQQFKMPSEDKIITFCSNTSSGEAVTTSIAYCSSEDSISFAMSDEEEFFSVEENL